MICSPQLVGGADANQNGLGDRMPPAKFVERSGMRGLEGFRYRDCGALSVRYCIHHFASAIYAVAAGIYLRTAVSLQERSERRLSNGWDYHVARQVKIKA
jgi:hypothetical protein